MSARVHGIGAHECPHTWMVPERAMCAKAALQLIPCVRDTHTILSAPQLLMLPAVHPPAFCLLADICAVCIHAAWPWEALVQARLQSCAGVPALRPGLPPSVQCSCHPSPAPWPAQTRTADDSQRQSGGEKGQTRPGLAPRTAGRCPMRSRVCTRISSLTAARQTPFPKSAEDAEEAGRTQGNYKKNVLPCL